jgi:hypothetical protein
MLYISGMYLPILLESTDFNRFRKPQALGKILAGD